MSRYENDHVLPSLPTVVRLAKAVGVTVTKLVNNTDRLEALQRRGVQIHSVAEAEHYVDLIEDDPEERRSGRGRRG